MEDSRPVGIPMSIGHKLSKDADSKEVNQTTYRYMIGKLQYVVYARSNISLIARIVARFSTNPRENHSMAIKRIMRYLKGTKNYGLWYKKGGNFDLKTFTDVNWVGSVDDRKRTSGKAFFLGRD